jgi:hypothetical protein
LTIYNVRFIYDLTIYLFFVDNGNALLDELPVGFLQVGWQEGVADSGFPLWVNAQELAEYITHHLLVEPATEHSRLKVVSREFAFLAVEGKCQFRANLPIGLDNIP